MNSLMLQTNVFPSVRRYSALQGQLDLDDSGTDTQTSLHKRAKRKRVYPKDRLAPRKRRQLKPYYWGRIEKELDHARARVFDVWQRLPQDCDTTGLRQQLQTISNALFNAGQMAREFAKTEKIDMERFSRSTFEGRRDGSMLRNSPTLADWAQLAELLKRNS